MSFYSWDDMKQWIEYKEVFLFNFFPDRKAFVKWWNEVGCMKGFNFYKLDRLFKYFLEGI